MQEKERAGNRKRPGVEEQKRVILEAAVDLFSAAGTRAVSVSQICTRAGISRDTYYRCFDDKDSLVSQLYQTSVNDHMLTVMGAADLDYGDPQWLHKVMSQTIDQILEQSRVARFLFIESADPASPAYKAVNDAFDKVARRMQTWARKTYGRSPPREFYKALLVASQWLVHNAIVAGESKREIDKAKRAAEELYYNAFAGIGAFPQS